MLHIKRENILIVQEHFMSNRPASINNLQLKPRNHQSLFVLFRCMYKDKSQNSTYKCQFLKINIETNLNTEIRIEIQCKNTH